MMPRTPPIALEQAARGHYAAEVPGYQRLRVTGHVIDEQASIIRLFAGGERAEIVARFHFVRLGDGGFRFHVRPICTAAEAERTGFRWVR